MSSIDRQIDSFDLEVRTGRIASAKEGDEMQDVETDQTKAMPSIIPSDIPLISDDECLLRLAQTVEDHDSERLDELARLIGRLAVTIE